VRRSKHGEKKGGEGESVKTTNWSSRTTNLNTIRFPVGTNKRKEYEGGRGVDCKEG